VADADPIYRERLSVPAIWWAVSVVCMAFGGLEVFGGFNWEVAIVVYVILAGFFLAPLAVLGRATVVVDHTGLHSGGQTLPLDQVRTATALDVEGTRRALGPAADPAAHVVLRGWIKTGVLIRVRGTGRTPYWLVSSRNPEELAATLRRAATKAVAASP
jgi:hypothetical protein